MTTTMKTKKTTVKKRTTKKADLPPLPPSAKVVEINGQDCIITPLAEYDDWLQDALLGVVMADRLKNGRDETVPFEDVVARLDSRKKSRPQ